MRYLRKEARLPKTKTNLMGKRVSVEDAEKVGRFRQFLSAVGLPPPPDGGYEREEDRQRALKALREFGIDIEAQP